MPKITPLAREARITKVYEYAQPYRSDAYALDAAGHGWDRLAAIAGEYGRGERTWAETRRLLDDNARDLTEHAARIVADA